MPSLSARALRRRPDLVAARAWRATVPGGGSRGTSHGSAVLLVLLAFLFFYMATGLPGELPWAVFLPLVVISGVIHRPGDHGMVVLVSLGCVAAGAVISPEDRAECVGALLAGLVIAAITMWRSMARARVGVQGRSGELLLEELRVGLERRGVLPRLGDGWNVEGCVDSAHGHPFSGDFIVAHTDEDRRRFEVVLVDISGKGLRAASRAVQLSGALDALLGAVPPEELLSAANDYVVRQHWGEGYATAVHLVVHLDTGEFQVYRAGHPPVGVFEGCRRRWTVMEEHVGPALGLVGDAVYRCDEGVLRGRDAVMLYSDGLVEQHDRALDDGIARLLGKAQLLVSSGFEGGAQRLCEEAAIRDVDDRSVVLLWLS